MINFKYFIFIFILIISEINSNVLKSENQEVLKSNGSDILNNYTNVHIYGNIQNLIFDKSVSSCQLSFNNEDKLRDGYTFSPGLGYYKYFKGTVRWHDALRRCENDDAHLIIINSQDEAEMLANILKAEPKPQSKVADWASYTHVGFHDKDVEGQYITIKGEPLATAGYWKWLQGQPDNANNNENCGSASRNGQLNDLWCYAETDFVCERDL